MNLFFDSQFRYCFLISMLHSCIINNKINRLYERYLRLLYRDKLSPFEKLLKQDKSVTIHVSNLQFLATKMFKVYQNISPPIFNEVFHRHDIKYNIRSVFYWSKSILYLGPKIWDIVPWQNWQLLLPLRRLLKRGCHKKLSTYVM